MKAKASAMRLSLDGDFDCSARSSNEADWAAMLFEARENNDEFSAIKLNSPFDGKMVIVADYYTSARYHGDVQQFMDARGGVEIDIVSSVVKSIIRGKGFSAAWNKYVLVFESGKDGGGAGVFHIGENKRP